MENNSQIKSGFLKASEKNISSFTVQIKCKNQKGNMDIMIYEVPKISQEELANGWKQILPKRQRLCQNLDLSKSSLSEINAPLNHEFDITLAELPPHLWNKPIIKMYLYLNNTSDTDNTEENYYFTIYDKIFTYNVIKSRHYETIYNLYIELKKLFKNKSGAKKLLNLKGNEMEVLKAVFTALEKE